MTEIIPGVLAKNLKELKEALYKISWAKKIHIDIMDGKFVPNKTIQAAQLRKVFPENDVEIHLMANEPQKYIDKYAEMGVKEFIFHCEATKKAPEIVNMLQEKGVEAGVAINPRTRVENHKPAFLDADSALVMTVQPGFGGQKFNRKVLEKIKEIKRINPAIKIGVDGGIHSNTCPHAVKAGADFVVATSEVTESPWPKKAYLNLKKICSKYK